MYTELLWKLLCILLPQESKLKIILLCKLCHIRNLCMGWYSHFQNKNFIAMEYWIFTSQFVWKHWYLTDETDSWQNEPAPASLFFKLKNYFHFFFVEGKTDLLMMTHFQSGKYFFDVIYSNVGIVYANVEANLLTIRKEWLCRINRIYYWRSFSTTHEHYNKIKFNQMKLYMKDN
jgi:hypothetical protein